jgi:FKBP-type peptidyl-prolyl cis-trans isomerase
MSSIRQQPGETRDLPAGKLIPGWIEALSMMKEGDEWELVIPAKLAYGEERSGNDLWGRRSPSTCSSSR